MTILIHGFGSSGMGGKASIFREHYKQKGEAFIAPSLSYVPELAIATLEELIENCPNPSLIGSSLGGFYAIYLAEKYNLKAVLINPAVIADKTLERHLNLKGFATNYYDGSRYEWNDKHLEMLKKYRVHEPKAKYLLMLQKGDEVLDYQDALNQLPNAELILEEGGSHTFNNIEKYFDKVDGFLLNRA